MNITGSIVQAYVYCPRKAWLMSRQITGDQYNEFLAIGRLIAEETFKREKKEILVEGGKIDVISKGKGELILIEVKKSSKYLKTSKMQLLFYLYKFSKRGYKVRGEIRIPKEKRVISVELGDVEIKKIETVIDEIEKLVKSIKAPEKKWKQSCKRCSYLEFCWG